MNIHICIMWLHFIINSFEKPKLEKELNQSKTFLHDLKATVMFHLVSTEGRSDDAMISRLTDVEL